VLKLGIAGSEKPPPRYHPGMRRFSVHSGDWPRQLV
jgi:hypothetical protein